MLSWGDGPTPFEGLRNIRCPVIGFFGDEDRKPVEDIRVAIGGRKRNADECDESHGIEQQVGDPCTHARGRIEQEPGSRTAR